MECEFYPHPVSIAAALSVYRYFANPPPPPLPPFQHTHTDPTSTPRLPRSLQPPSSATLLSSSSLLFFSFCLSFSFSLSPFPRTPHPSLAPPPSLPPPLFPYPYPYPPVIFVGWHGERGGGRPALTTCLRYSIMGDGEAGMIPFPRQHGSILAALSP